MAYLGMPLGNAIVVALVAVSYVTGTTSTVDSYAEHVAYGVAYVAQTHRFEFAIRSSHPGWYSDGMQIFAFNLSSHFWNKAKLTWDLKNSPTSMDTENVVADLKEAFKLWAAASSFQIRFDRAESGQRPDIQFEFFPEGLSRKMAVSMMRPPSRFLLDFEGVILQFDDSDVWTNRRHPRYSSFQFYALYEIGHALGLDDSDVSGSIMCGTDFRTPQYKSKKPSLTEDDRAAIQEKCRLTEAQRTAPTPAK